MEHARASAANITAAKVEIWKPKTENDTGNRMKYIRKRALTAGKMA